MTWKPGDPLPPRPPHPRDSPLCPNHPNGCLICRPGEFIIAQPKGPS